MLAPLAWRLASASTVPPSVLTKRCLRRCAARLRHRPGLSGQQLLASQHEVEWRRLLVISNLTEQCAVLNNDSISAMVAARISIFYGF
jgi:hypothetical protein